MHSFVGFPEWLGDWGKPGLSGEGVFRIEMPKRKKAFPTLMTAVDEKSFDSSGTCMGLPQIGLVLILVYVREAV